MDQFYNKLKGFIKEVHVPPINPLDTAAMFHDIAYGAAGNKKKEMSQADR